MGSGRGWSTPTARTVRFADHSLLEDIGVVVWATGIAPTTPGSRFPVWSVKATLCTGGA